MQLGRDDARTAWWSLGVDALNVRYEGQSGQRDGRDDMSRHTEHLTSGPAPKAAHSTKSCNPDRSGTRRPFHSNVPVTPAGSVTRARTPRAPTRSSVTSTSPA